MAVFLVYARKRDAHERSRGGSAIARAAPPVRPARGR